MSNLSFARIMYGSNQDLRSSGWMSASAIPSQPAFSAKPASLTLESLLHKAWLALSTKK